MRITFNLFVRLYLRLISTLTFTLRGHANIILDLKSLVYSIAALTTPIHFFRTGLKRRVVPIPVNGLGKSTIVIEHSP